VPSASRTDAELLAAHVAGDRFAFAELARRHTERLRAVALRVLRDREEAADAVQEALLAAHRAAPRFRGDCPVDGWLHRIVLNACRSRLRYARRRPTVPLPVGGPREPSEHPQAGLTDRMTVWDALATLTLTQRLAVVLVDVQGYPVAEAATILGVPAGTVKSRCFRGRARLARLLVTGARRSAR
jgi:RNA polymerase sigma-70 factor (ECF subfamily)